MTVILTIDPNVETAEIILRLSKANLPVIAVHNALNIIKVDASAEQFANIETIPGVVSIEFDHASPFAKGGDQKFGIVINQGKSVSDGDSDSEFFVGTVN